MVETLLARSCEIGGSRGPLSGRPRRLPCARAPHKLGTRSLADHGCFELRKHTEHLEQCPARWRRSVERLLMQKHRCPRPSVCPKNATRSCSDRPRRSTDQAAIMSNLRCTAAFNKRSNAGRRLRPLVPLIFVRVNLYDLPACLLWHLPKPPALVSIVCWPSPVEMRR